MRLLALLDSHPVLATITAPIVCHPRVQTWVVGSPRCAERCVDLLSSSEPGPWVWCNECFHRVS